MPLFHAVVWTDHQLAQVLQFGTEHVLANKFKAHMHHTKLHGSDVRTEHELFGEVCDTLDGIAEVLVTGSNTATADFRHYADKHWLQTAARIVGYEVVDHSAVTSCFNSTSVFTMIFLSLGLHTMANATPPPEFWNG